MGMLVAIKLQDGKYLREWFFCAKFIKQTMSAGTGDKIIGKAKEMAGSATGDKELEYEGKVQNAKGHVKSTTDMSGTSATTDKAVGSIKETTGKVIGDKELEYEGKAQNARGHAKEATAPVTGTAKGLTA